MRRVPCRSRRIADNKWTSGQPDNARLEPVRPGGALTLTRHIPSAERGGARMPLPVQFATRPPHRSCSGGRVGMAQGTQTRVARLGGTLRRRRAIRTATDVGALTLSRGGRSDQAGSRYVSVSNPCQSLGETSAAFSWQAFQGHTRDEGELVFPASRGHDEVADFVRVWSGGAVAVALVVPEG